MSSRPPATDGEALTAVWESFDPPFLAGFVTMSQMLGWAPQTQAGQGNPGYDGALNEVVPALLEQPGTVASPTKEDQQ